jgi:hypothetical protein
MLVSDNLRLVVALCGHVSRFLRKESVMKRLLALAAALSLWIAMPAQTASAAEEKDEKEVEIKFSEAPAAVQATMTEESKGAKIEMVEKEKEDGKWVFECEAMIKGKRYEIEVAEDGTLLCKKLEEHDDDDEKGDDKDDDNDKDDDKDEAKVEKKDK